MTIQIENEHTFKHALTNGLNLFLGSGFSVLARDTDGQQLPTARELKDELAKYFDISYATHLNLTQICTIIEKTRKTELHKYLKKRFTVTDFSPRYHNLENINFKTIFTTNIDDLLYKLYSSSSRYYINDLDIRGPVFNDRLAIDTITLHGSVLDDSRAMSFSATDLAVAFRIDPDRWHFLTQRIQTFPTLFCGYSMNDAGTIEALSPHTIRGRPQKDKWIVVHEDDKATVDYFRALDFQIIRADIAEILDYFTGVEATHVTIAPIGADLPTRELFPQEAIPDISVVPSRPIIDFYLGAPPSWSDIFAGRVYRTAHCARIRNSINSGRHTLVIGLTACGKTTLMMQVAQEHSFDGHKLILESPTIEKARLIVNKLSGRKALVFVDNFADSIETIRYLMDFPDILVLGFDRDYNFDIVSHRIDRGRCQILDVTELTDADIQEIVSIIPTNIKLPYAKIPTVSKGLRPSLFELIESNITEPSLQERFRSVLLRLNQRDKNCMNLLLVSCYVHSCRTPISMDMLLAFYRDIISDYHQIYDMCNRLGSMLSIYIGEFADEEQDYWIPRSTIMSEAVLKQAPSPALRRVLLRFISQISPYRIHRYDIFRKRAYDARTIGIAFQDWQEGKKYYEYAHQLDESPFLLQQGALYLAHHNRFDEAFAWIDDATIKSGGKNPSILHSHAIILFRANIRHQPTDSTVKDTLQRSMEILSECYSYDKRKTYHVLAFADQALQYHDVYSDETSLRYLARARDWLKEERELSPWNRNVKLLLTRVSSKLH